MKTAGLWRDTGLAWPQRTWWTVSVVAALAAWAPVDAGALDFLDGSTGGRPMHLLWDDPVVAVEPGGVAIEQDGLHLRGDPLPIREGEPMDVFVRWRVNEPPSPGAQLRIEVQGTGPAIRTTHPLGVEEVHPGAEADAGYFFIIHRLRYTGLGALRLYLLSEDGGTEESGALLFTAPVNVLPVTAPAQTEESDMRAQFGDDALLLRKAFRLGPGAELDIALPAEAEAGEWAALGLVSRLEFHPGFQQGEPVARFTFHRNGEVLAEVDALAGEATGFGSHEAYPAGELALEPAPVFESWPASGTDSRGEPYNVHAFKGVMTFEEAVRPTHVTVAYTHHAGLLEVRDLALLPTDGLAP